MSILNIVLPALIGMLTGGLFLGAYHFLVRKRVAPPVEKAPLHDPFTHGSRSDKRAAPRRNGNPVAIHYLPGEKKGQPVQGHVRDRSVGGLCLILPEQFAPGTFMRVLPVTAPDIIPWVEVEVKSCRKTGDGFEIGCQFIKQPPWSVLLLFG